MSEIPTLNEAGVLILPVRRDRSPQINLEKIVVQWALFYSNVIIRLCTYPLTMHWNWKIAPFSFIYSILSFRLFGFSKVWDRSGTVYLELSRLDCIQISGDLRLHDLNVAVAQPLLFIYATVKPPFNGRFE